MILQRMYIDENKEARVEKKLYFNFSKWLEINFKNGKPTSKEWIDVMKPSSPSPSPSPSPFEEPYESYYYEHLSPSPIVLD